MELRHLRYLVAVAESGSFAAAAKALHIAQPALTRQIRDAEEELGTAIFERWPRRVTLTPIGVECIAAAGAVLDRARAAAERARLAQEGVIGRAIIAFGKLPLGSGEAARLLDRARAEFPDIELAVVGAAFGTQWQLLLDGDADIGIGAEAPISDDRLRSHLLHEDWLDSAVFAASHPLAQRQSLRLCELANETLLWYGVENSESDRLLEGELHRRAEGMRVERISGDVDTVITKVAASGGWTLAPSWLSERLPAALRSVPLSDFAIRGQRFAVRRADDDRPIVQTLIDLMVRMGNGERPRPPREAPPPPPRWSAHGLPDIHHLRHFVGVVEEGSFGLAGPRLGITQPALSRQMRSLERDVGAPLLVRGTRGVTPTAAGSSLYHDAPAIIAAMDALQSRNGRILRAVEGRCVIGIVQTPRIARIAAALMALAERSLPRVELTIRTIDPPLQMAAVSDGSIDFALGHALPFAPTPGKLARESLAGGHLDTALLPIGHRLADRGRIKLRDLEGEPLVSLERSLDPDFHDFVMETFELNGFTPTAGPTYRSLEVVWAMVASGQGWTLGSDAQRAEPPGGTVGVAISDFSLPWGIDLVYTAGESRPPVVAMLKLVRDISRAAPSTDQLWSPVAPARRQLPPPRAATVSQSGHTSPDPSA